VTLDKLLQQPVSLCTANLSCLGRCFAGSPGQGPCLVTRLWPGPCCPKGDARSNKWHKVLRMETFTNTVYLPFQYSFIKAVANI